jgi:hypothetical protein
MTSVRLTELQGIVLDTIRAAGPVGVTADQIQHAADLSYQNSASRCSELIRVGAAIRKPLVTPDRQERTYERRKTSSGRNAAILIYAEFAK